MSWSQTDIDNIDDAIKKLGAGAKSVRYAERGVEYYDVDELLKIRTLAITEVNKAAGGKGHSLATFG